MGFTLVTVRGGPLTYANGTPVAGALITATLSEPIANGSAAPRSGIVASGNVSGDGFWQLVVPATTDLGTAPDDATILFACQAAGFSESVAVPAGSGAVTVAALAAGGGDDSPNVVTVSSGTPEEGQFPQFTGDGSEVIPVDSPGVPITVNDGPVATGLLPLAVTQQPLVPPSGIIQPLPPLIGFQFPGVANSIALDGAEGVRNICAGRDGNLWIPDNSNGKIFKVTPQGVVTTAATVAGTPFAICSGADGNLWTDDTAQVWRITPAGVTTAFPVTDLSWEGVCTGPDGNVWVCDDNSQVWRIQPDGTATAFPLPDSDPANICAGPDGNLWVTDYNGPIWKVTPAGVATSFAIAGGGSDWYGLCSGPDGNLWSTLQSSNAAVKISTAGELLDTFVLSDTAAPTWICTGAGGDLWVTDQGASPGLWKLTVEGAATLFPLPDTGPTSVCVGADGAFWIVDQTNQAVIQMPFSVQLGNINFTALPSADPHILGAPYSGAAGALFVSAG